MIKKYKIPYNSLTKESILTMIMNYEKNAKVGKVQSGLLKHKTSRTKSRERENLYTEKIVNKSHKRKSKIGFTSIYGQRRSARTRERIRKDYDDDYEFDLSDSKLSGDYREDIQLIKSLENESNGYNPENLNVIIDKSILFNNYVKEEEEKKSRAESVTLEDRREDINTLYVNKDVLDTYMTDYSQPLISPMGYRANIFPLTTKGMDMMPYEYTTFPITNLLRSPVSVDKYINKEINMTNKILINDIKETPVFGDFEDIQKVMKKNGELRIDLNIVNRDPSRLEDEDGLSLSPKSAFHKK